MTKEYQDLQHLDNEESDHHQLRRGPPAPQPLLRRLCSGPRLLLLSLGLSLLLLVVVCVIGSQSGCPGVGSEGSNSERGQVARLSSVIGSHKCPLLPRLPAAGGAAGPARDPEQLHLEHWGRSHGTKLQGRQCGEKDEVAGIRGGETAAGPEGRSLQPTAPREAVRVRPAQPKLSDGGSPGQWLSGHLLPRELGGARGQLLLVLAHGEALARGGQVLPAGERAPGGGHVPGGAEIYRAPHRFSEHLDGPLRPRWGLEVGGRHRLRGRLPELETRPAGRLVGARAGRRGGLRPLHQRRPLERRYVPATLPLGLRDEAGPGCLGAPSLLIYFLGASTCRGGRGSSPSWGRPSRILRAVEEDLTPPRALSVVGRLLSPTLIF